MKIAVIGSDGFVGAEIVKAIKSDEKYDLIRIVKGDDISGKIKSADFVIHAANPARRFMAEKEPLSDFIETAEKTFSLLKMAKENPSITKEEVFDYLINSYKAVYRHYKLEPLTGAKAEIYLS